MFSSVQMIMVQARDIFLFKTDKMLNVLVNFTHAESQPNKQTLTSLMR